ncbi:MAG: LL-diaminopimelate aminotransferase [Prevotella sp.]|nr:LL-diaminopimelate aminotransferase [Prevotella sp.]
MALVNDHFLKLPNNYLFADIAKKVNAFKVMHPKANIISLGIGDVTQPLAPAVIEAIHKAADEMSTIQGFHGYGPEQGYDFLREAILKNDFLPRGIHLDIDEIFINDGAKSDTGNIQELIRWDNSIGVTDPIYPVYIDSNVMIGRAGVLEDDGEHQSSGRWSNVVYMPCTAENGFVPALPDRRVDVIYLCFPNNPTGTVITKQELRKWVNYALKNDTLIFYDAAYQAYITDSDIPRSIYEIRGARKCAIEFHSYSKTAGFTGVRCGYTIVPKDLTAATLTGERIPLNPLWNRRQSTKFNGTSYISQRAAEAIYTPEGKKQVKQTIDYYMQNAKNMLATFRRLGFEVYGGENAPYIWMRTPQNLVVTGEATRSLSWRFFEELLYGANVVCTPGVGFGPSGEGYVRFTAFGSHEQTDEALDRIAKWANR